MKKQLYIILCITSFWLFSVLSPALGQKLSASIFHITRYGAKGNGKTINTDFINKAIEACEQAGGGTVIVPKGIFLTGTIVMKSNVHLYLEEGSVIKGINDLEAYRAYKPRKDMHKYGMAYFPNWTRGLIIATAARNMSITGRGTIDGSHVIDPKGEERMRGPHAIVFGECRNFEISGITIEKASNYAYVGYETENATFHNLTLREGWDGIHIRGGKNVIIRDCSFYTGDDAIAGGFWENVSISGCSINTACNGVRVIFPAVDLTIDNCRFQGPGLYPQRSTFDGQRRNMLAAIIIQPGGWDRSPGPAEKIHIHDLHIDNMDAAISFILRRHEGNYGKDILVERIHATNIAKSGYSVESWKGGVFENVVFRDIYTEFKGSGNLEDVRSEPYNPETYKMPYWGFFGRNIQDLTLENVELKYSGSEIRPAMGFDNVEKINLKNVRTMDVPHVERAVFIHSGTVNEK